LIIADLNKIPPSKTKSEDVVIVPGSLHSQKAEIKPKLAGRSDIVERVYKALVLGTRDYVLKNGFRKVVLGLSGGIDSALVAAVAVDALGADNVIAVNMPSRYSSSGTIKDSTKRSLSLIWIYYQERFQVCARIVRKKIFKPGFAGIFLWRYLINSDGWF
jgi:NAD+ synthase (glutamine-hydrolysing)